jgi:excisionase family DNA binding protein
MCMIGPVTPPHERPNMPDKLLTTRELEDRLQLDRVTIYRMVKDGELPALRVGGQWRFSANAIDAWLGGRDQKTTDSADAPIVPDLAGLAGLRLADLVSIDTLQSIQDQFAQLLGVAAFITDLDGQPFAPCSRCSRFCRLVHTTEEGMQSCQQSWRTVARLDEEGANVHTCHANIRYASAPVVVNGQRVGMVTAGQFLTEAPDPTAFRERALATGARIGVDGEALAATQDSLEIVSTERALQITALLAVIANALSGISYQGYLARQALARIAEISGATPPELTG